MDKELLAMVRAYLDGSSSVDELYNWAFTRVEELVNDPRTQPLAGAILGGMWTLQDGNSETSFREELRTELSKRPAAAPR